MWLDVWRGIAVINMCLYHGLWDLVYYFRLPGFDWYSALPGYVWQQSICWSFIFLSGYSYALGKNKFRLRARSSRQSRAPSGRKSTTAF